MPMLKPLVSLLFLMSISLGAYLLYLYRLTQTSQPVKGMVPPSPPQDPGSSQRHPGDGCDCGIHSCANTVDMEEPKHGPSGGSYSPHGLGLEHGLEGGLEGGRGCGVELGVDSYWKGFWGDDEVVAQSRPPPEGKRERSVTGDGRGSGEWSQDTGVALQVAMSVVLMSVNWL